MCLMPFGGGGNILIPPSPPARKLGDYLKVGIFLHFVIAIYIMLGGRYVDGVFDLLGVLIGFMSIKNSEGYSFTCVLSYCVYTGMDVFWACLRLILYFSGATSTDSGSSDWQHNVFVSGLIISPFIYLYCCVISYKLYKELKRMVDEANGQQPEGSAPSGGNASGYAQQQDEQPPQQGGGFNWSHRETHPTAPAGFKPFSGAGHKLGGSTV